MRTTEKGVGTIKGDAEGINFRKGCGWGKEPSWSECRVGDIFSCQLRANLGHINNFRRRIIHTKEKVVEYFYLPFSRERLIKYFDIS
jgi:hypothetical protein